MTTQDQFKGRVRDVRRYFTANARELDLDKSGRLNVPAPLCRVGRHHRRGRRGRQRRPRGDLVAGRVAGRPGASRATSPTSPSRSRISASSSPLTTEYRHTPVLLAEVLQYLSLHDRSTIVDCTLGGAGHSRAILEQAPDTVLIGIDQDDAALDAARDALRLGQQVALYKGNFGDLDRILTEAGIVGADGFLFDLGVSSPQLDRAERGFSFHADAPLDMRMDPAAGGISAADVVNTYDEAELTRVLREYGDERWASRIAAFITAARGRRPITTTGQLVDLVKDAVPAAARRVGGHPARRTFQALRIEVNDELGVLERGLRSAVKWLFPRGRLLVISYHSLEDRIVKRVFSELSEGCTCPPDLPVCACGAEPVLRVITKRPVVPTRGGDRERTRAREARGCGWPRRAAGPEGQ